MTTAWRKAPYIRKYNNNDISVSYGLYIFNDLGRTFDIFLRLIFHEMAGFARGPLGLDTVVQRTFLNGEDILLQPREYAALCYLMQHEGEGVSAERLYETVWKLPANGSASAARTAVSRLRKKLEGSGYTITSGWGKGYCFERET